MIPILFDRSEQSFSYNGLGRLPAISCIVEERVNDFYTLTMNIPANEKHAQDIIPGRLILATPSDGERPQPFRVYEVDKALRDTIDVYANHISYDLSGYPMRTASGTTAATAVASLSSRAIISPGFTFSTDLSVTANWSLKSASSIRAAMGDMLNVYGGEWYYDRYAVKLMAHRGTDNGVSIRYGQNMTELDAVTNGEDDYTGAFAFYYSNGSYVSSNIIYSDQTAVPQKILIVDHTSDFQSTPTTAQLDTVAAADLAAAAGVTSSLEVSFVPSIAHVKLGDIVTVIYDKYKINKKLEVVQTVYNVLLERYETIELGVIRPNLADIILSLQGGQ